MQRAQLWRAMEDLTAAVSARGMATYPQIRAQAADLLRKQGPATCTSSWTRLRTSTRRSGGC
ncbi:hypothetical protein [Streptomyces sp. NPDC000229]|uniref:hypothetical protein n=1 Tax=Streptomyces sp. NPDC000229 TaxID=3154247 RepID=UPI00332CB440